MVDDAILIPETHYYTMSGYNLNDKSWTFIGILEEMKLLGKISGDGRIVFALLKEIETDIIELPED
jgi:hypothetical protein